jgi:hypothetical protein
MPRRLTIIAIAATLVCLIVASQASAAPLRFVKPPVVNYVQSGYDVEFRVNQALPRKGTKNQATIRLNGSGAAIGDMPSVFTTRMGGPWCFSQELEGGASVGWYFSDPSLFNPMEGQIVHVSLIVAGVSSPITANVPVVIRSGAAYAPRLSQIALGCRSK